MPQENKFLLDIKEVFENFPDCWFEREHGCIVAIFPYGEHLAPREGFVALSNYYIASNRAYHTMIRATRKLKEFGISAKVDHRLPARTIAVIKKGFIGDNGFYFHPEYGSFVYIGILIVGEDSVELVEKCLHDFPQISSQKKGCAGCGVCKKTCPTGALQKSDMSLCIREHILKNPIPKEISSYINQLYGCERCQICCPENNITYENPIEFNIQKLRDGEHFEEIRELVGKNIAKRDNIIAQAEIIKTNKANKGKN